MLKTAVVTDRRYLKHFAGRAHPERPERAEVMTEMAESLRRPDVKFMAPREATDEEIASCHQPEYIATVAHTASLDRFDFDPDTHSSRDTYETALLSAGGVLTAVEAVMDGAVANRIARPEAGDDRRLGRPPWQRPAGYFLRIARSAVRLDPSVSALPRHRIAARDRLRRWDGFHRQPADAGGIRRRRVPARVRSTGHADRTPFQARVHPGVVRLRRPCSRPLGADARDRRGIQRDGAP